MKVPGFTAESAFADAAATSYSSFDTFRAAGTSVTAQASRHGGLSSAVAGCFVNCLKHGGGSDAEAQIQTCMYICQKFGGSVAF